MSFETEYPLVEWPRRRDLERALAAVARAAQVSLPTAWMDPWADDDDDDEDEDEDEDGETPLASHPLDAVLPERSTITVQWLIPVARAIDVAIALGATVTRDDIARDLLPPVGEVDWEAAERAGVAKREVVPGIRVPIINRNAVSATDQERFRVRPDDYTLLVSVVAPDEAEELPPRVVAGSNVGDNSEGWIVLHYLCEATARELMALVEN